MSRGPLAVALLPMAALFWALGSLRRGLYAMNLLRAQSLAVPVIVVGNLIAGGAGKTPTVLAIVALLRSRGFRPGVVSRGYGRHARGIVEVTQGASAQQVGDEPLLLHVRTGSPVVVGSDRVRAATALLAQHPSVDIVVSDDGLQHLALPRDVQVLVFDERGAGNGWVLPAGPLREPLPGATPPRSLVVYNAARPTTMLPGTLCHRSLAGAVALNDWWQGHPATMASLHALRGRRLLAAAGVARPQRFFEMLRGEGLTFDALPLPDHFDYATLPWAAGTSDVILTEKDAIKLSSQRTGATRVWVAPLDFALGTAFDAALIAMLPGPRHGNTTP